MGEIKYEWFPGPMVTDELLQECAALYSEHYGVWSQAAPQNPGGTIRLSPSRLKAWFNSRDSNIGLARRGDALIAYAISIRTKVPAYGVISWVSQLVVHADHRRANVAKTLLFSMWGFSNHFAWGLVTANPYAVRALEKATRRRCVPARIRRNAKKLRAVGSQHVPYVPEEVNVRVDAHTSSINTAFFMDHSQLPSMVASTTSKEKPWLLGELDEGWEWFAFTFHDQEQIRLTREEIDNMLSAADQVTRQAYSRMSLGPAHAWAKYAEAEVDFVIRNCNLQDGNTVLDLGCGVGRHLHVLAQHGINGVGVDYVSTLVNEAKKNTNPSASGALTFHEGDARAVDLGVRFDAVTCLYDVVGTYANDSDNLEILRNIVRHIKPGGFALLSVMNLDATLERGPETFTMKDEPDRLLALPASNTMEETGDIFNPEFLLVDRETDVVYRKEQFSLSGGLPTEMIVRDRRFTKESIEGLCVAAGLEVVWSRYVRAGNWEKDAPREKGKEILVLCRLAVAN